jgi:hypothetical protein
LIEIVLTVVSWALSINNGLAQRKEERGREREREREERGCLLSHSVLIVFSLSSSFLKDHLQQAAVFGIAGWLAE